MRTRLVAAAAALALSLAAGYLYGTPYLAFQAIREAIQTGDREALSEQVDFPQLRQGITDQLNAAILNEGGEELEDNPFGAVAMVMASKFIEATVDAYVTPDGIAMLARGKLNKESQNPDGTPALGNGDTFETADLGYDSFTRFVARLTGPDGGEPVQLVLSRRGLSWQLTNIILPMDNLALPEAEVAGSPGPHPESTNDTYLAVRDKMKNICEQKLGELTDPSAARWDASESKAVITSRKWLIGYIQPFVVTENGEDLAWTISCRSILLDNTWTFDLIVYRGPDDEILRVIDGFEDADDGIRERVVAMRSADQEIIRFSDLMKE